MSALQIVAGSMLQSHLSAQVNRIQICSDRHSELVSASCASHAAPNSMIRKVSPVGQTIRKKTVRYVACRNQLTRTGVRPRRTARRVSRTRRLVRLHLGPLGPQLSLHGGLAEEEARRGMAFPAPRQVAGPNMEDPGTLRNRNQPNIEELIAIWLLFLHYLTYGMPKYRTFKIRVSSQVSSLERWAQGAPNKNTGLTP